MPWTRKSWLDAADYTHRVHDSEVFLGKHVPGHSAFAAAPEVAQHVATGDLQTLHDPAWRIVHECVRKCINMLMAVSSLCMYAYVCMYMCVYVCVCVCTHT
jgi:hypothetical protein